MNLSQKLENSRPVILFRRDFSRFGDSNEEFESCLKNFPDVTTIRSLIGPGELVIGRYSVLPYYRELQSDLSTKGSALINSYTEHCWISNFSWYEQFKRFTPKTWRENEFMPTEFPADKEFIVKGATNSRKHEWNSMMYAATPQEAVRVSIELRRDSLIGTQDIIFREYVPLETFETGIAGLPFTNEWRFFCLENKIITAGYYWGIAECADKMTKVPEEAFSFARRLTKIVQNYATFYVLDIAKTKSGDWILIEINDGQMSGLNTIDPNEFYKSLAEAVKTR